MAPHSASTFEEFASLDAIALAKLVAGGEVSAADVLDASLEMLERWNPALNALIHPRNGDVLTHSSRQDNTRQASTHEDGASVDIAAVEEPLPDSILLESRRLRGTTSEPGSSGAGALAGVPFAVKDLGCAQAGEPHHRGARFLRDIDFRSEQDSYLWQRFRWAGLISIGRTNTPEFGSTITTEPLAYGPTRNPWDLSRTPGGSSGGAAALVAAGVVPIAHGNDGGGSLRVPASMCGLVGLKASRGRISVGPDAGTSLGGFAVDGVVTRSVRDTALALDIMAGPEPGDPYWAAPPVRPFRDEPGRDPGRLRVGVVKRRMGDEMRSAIEAAARLLDDLGHVVTPDVHPKGWFDPELTDRTIVIRSVGMARSISLWEQTLGRSLGEGDVEPQNLYAAELGRSLPGLMVLEATNWLHDWARQVIGWWDNYDLLLSPVVGGLTPPIGFLSDPDEGQRRLGDLLGFVDQANVSGQPAISVPLAVDTDNMPIGIQLIAAPQREDILVQVAAQLEAAAPWSHRRPTPPPT